MEYVTLRNGVKMPMEGFGAFQVEAGAVCEQTVTNALNASYRLLDTAAAYFNEESVGAAIQNKRDSSRRAVHHNKAMDSGCRL